MNVRNVASLVATLVVLGGAGSSAAASPVWPTDVVRTRQMLRSADVEQRRDAGFMLTQLPRGSCRRLAAEAANDVDVGVRLAAAHAAYVCQAPDVATVAVGWLTSRDQRLQLAACDLLRRFPRGDAVPALTRLLGDSNPRVRIGAVRALANAEPTDAANVPALIARLDDPSERVRLEVIAALRVIGDRRAVVPLLSRVQDSSVVVRREAIAALGRLGDRKASSVLMVALDDSAPQVRLAAVRALGRLREPGVEPLLGALLRQGSSRLSKAAAHALSKIGTAEALEMLLSALEEEEPSLGEHPVRDAIVTWGKDALPQVRRVLQSSTSMNVVAGCALIVASLGDTASLPLVRRAAARGHIPKAIELEVLGRLGGGEDISVALASLGVQDLKVRFAAARATELLLKRRGGSGLAVDPLVRLMMKSEASSRQVDQVVGLLGLTRSRRAVDPLAQAALVEGPLRVRAVQALGQTRLASAAEKLMPILSAPEPRVRWVAARAVALAGADPQASELLAAFERNEVPDEFVWGIALAGPLSRTASRELLDRARRVVESSSGARAEWVLRAVAGNSSAEARAVLRKFAKALSPWVRMKVAEILGLTPGMHGELLEMLSDPDDGVRANAVWSLGLRGHRGDEVRLIRMVRDRNEVVVANALGALAELARRGVEVPTEQLCKSIGANERIIAVNALVGARLAGASCDDAQIAKQLFDGAWPEVRVAAARLLASGKVSRYRARLLRRCVRDDPSSTVARACARAVGDEEVIGVSDEPKNADSALPRMIWVRAEGQDERPGQRFTLEFSSGLLRAGWADRTGGVLLPPGGAAVKLLAE